MSIQQKELKIGLFGFGVVGEGLYKVLNQTSSINASIKKVCIKHPEKKRNAPQGLFTTYPEILISDSSINVIVELIDDADAAFDITKRALQAGKAVVSANKKMIAEHLPELIELQKKHNVPLLYEAACCASIPVLRNMEEYYDNDLLQGVCGIVNGSTNYILSKIFEEDKTYTEALKDAQEKGFAESNPDLDVKGIDAVNKLSIILSHAYGVQTPPKNLIHFGIQNILATDAVYAQEKGYEIKLVAKAQKINKDEVAACVLPQFVKKDSLLHSVRNEYNGVIIESGLADAQFFYGKGAGSFPTASAVLSDISALRYDYKYEYKKLHRGKVPTLASDLYLNIYLSVENAFDIPQDKFARIDEWSINEERTYVTGVIAFKELQNTIWWKKEGVSLILLPEPFLSELPEKEPTIKQLQLV